MNEELKKIAEYMGYEVRIIDDVGDLAWVGILDHNCSQDYYKEYSPLQNNDQLVEIDEKLMKEGAVYFFELCKDGNIKMMDYYKDEVMGEGKTRAEAVCNAVLAMIEGEL